MEENAAMKRHSTVGEAISVAEKTSAKALVLKITHELTCVRHRERGSHT